MAWVSSALSSDEQTQFANDKPILSSHSGLARLQEAQWAAGYNADLDDPDEDKAGSEAYKAVDGYPGLSTEPDGTGTGWTILWNWPDGIEFDSFHLIYQNLWSSGVDLFSLSIADDRNFTSNVQTLFIQSGAAWPNQGKRHSYWTLDHTSTGPRRYSQVEYARVGMLALGSYTPRLGQCVFGRRTQLHHDPRNVYDPDNLRGNSTFNEAFDGTLYSRNKHTGKRILEATLALTDEDRFNDVRDEFVPNTNYLADPFVWCERPTSDEHNFQLMQEADGPEVNFPYFAWRSRDFRLSAVEQGPYFQENEPNA